MSQLVGLRANKYWQLGVVVGLIGFSIRVSAAQGELWFDEVWSVLHTRGLQSILDVLLIRHDNSHPLTSIWLWHLPTISSPLLFRLLALAFAACTIITLVTMIARRRNRDSLTYLVWLFLIMTSYLCVLYDSEARGYSGLVATSVLLFALRDYFSRNWNLTSVLLYTLIILVGFLSHALFILFLIPYLMWCWSIHSRHGAEWKSLRDRTAICAGIIACVGLPVYSTMAIGGAPIVPFVQVGASSLILALGGDAVTAHKPELAAWWLLAGACAVGMTALEFKFWFKEHFRDALFVLLVLVVPPLIVIVTQPYFLLPRYFLVVTVFFYFVLARFLVRLFHLGVLGKCISVTAVCSFLFSNTLQIDTLIRSGRSVYLQTLKQIALEDPVARIGGNQDFQNTVRLSYSSAVDPTLQGITYTPLYTKNLRHLDFVLLESVDREEPFPEQIGDSTNGIFKRISLWRAPPESGANRCLYQRFPKFGGPLSLTEKER